MDAELADRGIDRRHFGGEIGGNLHLLARGEDVELVGVEDEPAIVAGADRLPEFIGGIGAGTVDVDHVAVLDRAISDDLAGRAAQGDAHDKPFADFEIAVDKRGSSVAPA